MPAGWRKAREKEGVVCSWGPVASLSSAKGDIKLTIDFSAWRHSSSLNFQVLFLALCDNMRVNYESLEKAGQMLDRLQYLNLVQVAMKIVEEKWTGVRFLIWNRRFVLDSETTSGRFSWLLVRWDGPSETNWEYFLDKYSVSSLVVPKMEEEFSGTGAMKNSKWHDKSW